MCDETHAENTNSNTSSPVCNWSLENIPVEIFLHICSYLDARFITHTLSLVCKQFHVILSDESIWKSRITQRWGSIYPPIPVDTEEFNWRLACVCIEDQYDIWHRKDVRMRPLIKKDIHYASVDAVHVMKIGNSILCVSGARDRCIVVWDLRPALEGGTEVPSVISANAHQGWIWGLDSCDETIYSCSWDTTIKSWNFTPNLCPVSVFQCKTAVVSLACSSNLVAAGTYSRVVKLFDTRVGESQVNSYKAHQRAVLSLSISGDFIASVSEDQTLAIWDQRAHKVLKQLKLYEDVEETAFPMCLSYNDNLLYVGDTKGQLHLLNPSKGQFDIIRMCQTGHSGKLTCVKHGMGSIITSSTDGTVRISTSTQEPQTIAVITSEAGEVTGFDYKNNILAVGGTESAVEFWLPCSS